MMCCVCSDARALVCVCVCDCVFASDDVDVDVDVYWMNLTLLTFFRFGGRFRCDRGSSGSGSCNGAEHRQIALSDRAGE